jgi:hypothetical protein
MQCSLLPTNCDYKQTGMQTAIQNWDSNWDENWDANRDTAIQTGMQTEDANCETAMPCNATAYYCHHDWDSTAM